MGENIYSNELYCFPHRIEKNIIGTTHLQNYATFIHLTKYSKPSYVLDILLGLRNFPVNKSVKTICFMEIIIIAAGNI
jgi:hypothetical protein